MELHLTLLYILLVDENVVVGNSPASADKTSITDYGKLLFLSTFDHVLIIVLYTFLGSLDSIGEKLAKKRYFSLPLHIF